MKNRIKQISFLLILIFFISVPNSYAQTSEIDTIFYYDRTTGDFLFWIDTCLSPGYCQPIAVGFDLSPEHSYTLTELRMSFYAQGKYPYSIHKGIEWPGDSNKIYQDTIIVQRSERDSIGDSLIVYKSIMFEDIPELNNLTGKFWVVIDIKTYSLAITDGDHDIFSTHSFYKFITDASWDSVHGEWVIDAIVEKKQLGLNRTLVRN